MKTILYPHGGSGNHGCEAIVRSTLKITQVEATLFSDRENEDLKYGLGDICKVLHESEPLPTKSWRFVNAYIQQRIFGDKDALDRARFRPIFDGARHADFALSIGGDNYCYGIPYYIYIINKRLREMQVPTFLWGCSVEPESIKGNLLSDLQGYQRIFARESLTFEAMKAAGLENVSLHADPAFQLNRVDLPLPQGFQEGNTVGINVSPLIIRHESADGMTLQNYTALIQHIIDHSDMQIALIPHVVWKNNDDRQPLSILYGRFKESGRVVLLEDHRAEELKGFLARCRFVIAARTHASIAAYSQQVPTLVIGYSVKARGIAKDIFGTHENYVLPVQSLSKPDELTEAFQWLVEHEKEIKDHYRSFMPGYLDSAMAAGQELKKYL